MLRYAALCCAMLHCATTPAGQTHETGLNWAQICKTMQDREMLVEHSAIPEGGIYTGRCQDPQVA